jgi:5-formyltetrahydrofolate cyclo-ligase
MSAPTDKPALRRWLRRRRRIAIERQGPELAEAVRDRFLANFPVQPGTVVAGYHALPSELNPAPLLRSLVQEGIACALPVVPGRGVPLGFRSWAPGDPLRTGSFRVREPLLDAPLVTPDLVLLPLVGFDEGGGRLGYGGGYYDRTLEQLRARGEVLAIGLALELQCVEDLPQEGTDERLDAVVTEERVLNF